TYLPYYLMALRRTEPDDDQAMRPDGKQDKITLKDISFKGLAMAKLKQMRDGQYPKVEDELENIKTTLEKLNKVEVVAAPNPFEEKNFDPFDPDASGSGDYQQPGMGPPGPGPGPGPGTQPGSGMGGGFPGYRGFRGGKGKFGAGGEEPGG